MHLSILADANIPHVRSVFSDLGTVSTFTGPHIPAGDLAAADVLLVRSITRVDEDVVTGSRVRFVGSATSGTDHIDTAALRRLGIAFDHAPGSNAESVVEYVIAAMLLVASRRREALAGKTLGIVGCGNVGSRLAERAPALGLRVLKCDPFLNTGAASEYVSLESLLGDSDIVSVHVPLTRRGPHPTLHMLDAAGLRMLGKHAWLINTSRGPVVDGRALLAGLIGGQLDVAVLDVWEREPTPDVALLGACTLATPHIAGHSFDGKMAGTIMLYQAILRHLGSQASLNYQMGLAAAAAEDLQVRPPRAGSETAWLHGVVRQMYDLAADDKRMRRLAALPADCQADYYAAMRHSYPARRAFHLHCMNREHVPAGLFPAVEKGLRVALR